MDADGAKANESLGKKDVLMRIKISRKESKETAFWLRLLWVGENPAMDAERNKLVQEAIELMKILGASYRKSE